MLEESCSDCFYLSDCIYYKNIVFSMENLFKSMLGYFTPWASLKFEKVLKWSSVYIFKNGQGSYPFSLLDSGRFKFLKSTKDENNLECLFLSPCPSLSLDWSGSGSI